jgi:Antitoxin ParD
MSSSKTSRLSLKPKAQLLPSETAASDWVNNRNGIDDEAIRSAQVHVNLPEELPPTRMKRITFEVTEEQHQSTKVYAAQQGMTIKELMQNLLDRELSKIK